jgi:flagellar FliL protein
MATADTADTSTVELPAAARARGSRLPTMLLVLLLLIVLGLCGYLLMSMRALQEKVGGAGATDSHLPASVELYAPLDPAFVVNFKDADSVRYLQVGVTVMAHDAAVIQAVKDADPVIRNALLMLFSNQDYNALSDVAGKQKLQADALAAVRKIVAARLGHQTPGVDALYFTSFVMQ